MKYLEIEEKDLLSLLSTLDYVVVRYSEKDPAMCDHIREVKKKVESHLDNERRGSEIASEIDVILDFIGGDSE
jgi:hypothetical protein